ncbi:tryptophan--tRNA ligase [Candidatus Kaiserbacteria bacterium RIFCSPHIGHO2_02_FULL_49_11]|uniref:Tryptophan--tRNA ligase n=1 Tax=Candidatus Kaiserbacteria bacterium RIFCSPHIGHO2_02_FULL_49_11 TaxID=1798489 RepID=A0A1F6CZ99_9BACT|nr:MAG: tryptophan--tRNA ligase [Candidatus Kaiserbacteria bacterium RIFCSPHIGHO2_02_FULL_49_11]
MTEKKILLSGIKPTGELHLGNYLGAMKQFLDFQDDYRSFIFIADYHALTTAHDAPRLRENIYKIAAGYLAIGLDPNKIVLYKQSDLPEHTELAWIFNSLTTMPYLMRAHAFKDAQAKNKEISVGTFDYPMLMAADILLYDPHVVPVGKDQKQHVEIARDTAEKFNRTFGETFRLPEAFIPEEVATIPGIDGQKMSKSYKNTIPLFGFDSEIQKAVFSIVTDSKGEGEPKDPEKDIIFALHRFFSVPELGNLEKRYREGGIGYKESKEILYENLKKLVTPIREKYLALLEDKENIKRLLGEGAQKARTVASAKMSDVRNKIGVAL